MTKREKIIVGVMCLSIVYGAYELIGSRGTKTSAPAAPTRQGNPTDETRTFVTEMTQKLVAERMGAEAQHTAKQASAEWTKDPFLQTAALLESKQPSEPPASKQGMEKSALDPTFAFTGFLQIGNVQLAIINGMEYAVGDTIGTDGYLLESISPEGVVLGNPNGDKIQLTLSETD